MIGIYELTDGAWDGSSNLNSKEDSLHSKQKIGNSSEWKHNIALPLCIIQCFLVEKILPRMGLWCGRGARHGVNGRPITMSDGDGEIYELPLILNLYRGSFLPLYGLCSAVLIQAANRLVKASCLWKMYSLAMRRSLAVFDDYCFVQRAKHRIPQSFSTVMNNIYNLLE